MNNNKKGIPQTHNSFYKQNVHFGILQEDEDTGPYYGMILPMYCLRYIFPRELPYRASENLLTVQHVTHTDKLLPLIYT